MWFRLDRDAILLLPVVRHCIATTRQSGLWYGGCIMAFSSDLGDLIGGGSFVLQKKNTPPSMALAVAFQHTKYVCCGESASTE